ncbi:MAG: hypothetical protein Q9201_000318 [Fulgogasparrea decipioides]
MLLATTLFILFSAPSVLAVTCYSHDQVSAADSPYANGTASLLVACNAGHANSTCCFAGETCAPDLLCHKGDGTVRRQYCTDPTWTTDQCSPLCPDYDAAGTILTKCNDGSYCCGYDNTDCCDQGAGTKIDKKGQIVAKGQITSSIADRTSTSSSSATDSSSTTSSTASRQTAAPATTANPTLSSPTTTPSSGLSGGAKAGIAIGCVAGAALVAGLLFLLFRERRKSRAMQSTLGKNPYAGNAQGVPMIDSQFPPQEMSAYNTSQGKYQLRGELDGQSKPQELQS